MRCILKQQVNGGLDGLRGESQGNYEHSTRFVKASFL